MRPDSVPPVMTMVQSPLAFFRAMTPWIVRARTSAREVRPTGALIPAAASCVRAWRWVSLPFDGAGVVGAGVVGLPFLVPLISLFHVFGPMIPSAVRPWDRWNAAAAFWVFGP